MSAPVHRIVDTNGIRMHIAEQGAGPAVLLCHGFPELWYSWRHQLAALAAAGFHAIAPDMRGYGQTDAPPEVDRYTLLHHLGDVLGLLDALGLERAVIAGHDWGAPLAWLAGQLRPDRFHGVIALSGPFGPRGQRRPTEIMPQSADSLFYQLSFRRRVWPRASLSTTFVRRYAPCFTRFLGMHLTSRIVSWTGTPLGWSAGRAVFLPNW